MKLMTNQRPTDLSYRKFQMVMSPLPCLVVGSRLGFSGLADRVALFQIEQIQDGRHLG